MMRKKLTALLLAVVLLIPVLAGCGSGSELKYPGKGNTSLMREGMDATRVIGLSADTDLVSNISDEGFTAKAAICYNLTRESVVFSQNVDEPFVTDRFSPLTLVQAYAEYHDNPDRDKAYDSVTDIWKMIPETFTQTVSAAFIYRTAREALECEDFKYIFSDVTYEPRNERLKIESQLDAYDDENGYMRFLHLKKDEKQFYILVVLGCETKTELNDQTDLILSYLIR